jgi:diadenosine tetraphosphatase ApaH/serine/threonine PP2A family protein phosphatase
VSYPRTALISDLHSNLPALETALADARLRGAERFVCLGDVIGYGAKPRECLDRVMELCVAEPRDAAGDPARVLYPGLCLQGNHELALLESAEDFNPKARAAIEWTRAALGGPDGARYWDFIGELVPAMCDSLAMFAHGSPRNPVKEYMLPRDAQDKPKLSANFAAMQQNGCSVCFVGHSHVPAIYFEDGELVRPQGTMLELPLSLDAGRRMIVNVGSVGQPRDGDPRLSYVLFDGSTVSFVRLEYDHRAAADAIRAVPELPEYLADRLAVGR